MIKIFFLVVRFFIMIFLKLVKKSLLVDLLTFVAIKKLYNDVYLKISIAQDLEYEMGILMI